MHFELYKPTPVILPENGPLRVPSRPAEFRDASFPEKFDYQTLFYDCFSSIDDRSTFLLGPPLFNLRPLLESSTWHKPDDNTTPSVTARDMDRHSRVILSSNSPTRSISLQGPIGHFDISVQPSLANMFEGKRVVMTLSKNNRLEWIKDWIRFNRDAHGANAVLFYDNNSTKYDLEGLADAISSLDGIDAACLVSWPFRYGPQGVDELRFWDSDFCQRGMLEHARWLFLQKARSVLNGDVDELIVNKSGRSIFEATEASLTGMTRFWGVWVYGVHGGPESVHEGSHSYASYPYYLNPKRASEVWHRNGFCNSKWCVVPSRCMPKFQWVVHEINGWRGYYSKFSKSTNFIYRHYREISDSWHYDRNTRYDYKPDVFLPDDAIRKTFGKVSWEK